MTPDKYECDSMNLTCAFAISTILLTEKLTNGDLVTPTPDVKGCGTLCKETAKVNQNGGAQRSMGTLQDSHHNIDVNKGSSIAPRRGAIK